MIVCQCKVLSDRDIDDVIAGGAVTLGAVCRRTGAGTDCGCCVFAIKNLLWEHIDSGVRHIGGRLEALMEVPHATEQFANRRAS